MNDLSFRALEVLKNVDCILCEDTRRAQKLKARYSIQTPVLSLHEHNEKKRIPQILSLMEKGSTFALISDAGYPLISDPGFLLIRELIRLGIPYTCVPGPSAAITALVLSGFPTQSFCFQGFLAAGTGERSKELEKLKTLQDHTLILFESPERIIGLLREIGENLGDRQIAVCRELTKLHEEVLRGTVSTLMVEMSGRKLRGEYTIVIAPGEGSRFVMSEETIRTRFQQLLGEGYNRKEALKKLSKESGRSRNELYDLLVK